jgi:hypothetical protein
MMYYDDKQRHKKCNISHIGIIWTAAFILILAPALYGQEANLPAVPDSAEAPAVKAADASTKAKEDQKAREAAAKQARAEATVKAKAQKEAEKKAAAEAEAKIQAERKAKAEEKARLKAEKKALEEQNAREAAKVKAEAKAKTQAEKKAAAEAKAKMEAEKKAAKLKAKEAEKAKEEAEQKATAEAKAKMEAEKKAAAAAEAVAEAQKKAAEEAAKKAAAETKARAEAEEKAERAAELKAEQEVKVKKQSADTARKDAAKKAEEAGSAEKAAKKIAKDKKAKPEAVQKAQDDAALKQAQAREAAGAAAAREAEYKQAAQNFEKSQQEKKMAKQKAAAEAKAKVEAEKKAAIEAKIKAQEEARARKAEGRLGAEPRDQSVMGRIKRSFESAADASERGKWNLSVGILLRMIHGQTFRTESYAKDYNISAQARDVFRRYSPAGDLNSYSDRTYEDGYVNKDDYTDLDGGTRYWGYDSGGQIEGNSVVFSFVGRTYTDYSRSREVTVGETDNHFDRELAPYIQLERVIYRLGWFDAGLHLDFYHLAFSDEANYANFKDTQRWKNYAQYDEDVYSIAGTGLTRDSPPYHGSRGSTTGPLINNIPDQRRSGGTVETGSYTYEAYNDIKQSLEMNLSTMSLGPSLSANWWRLQLSGITGATFNFINMTTHYYETLYASDNNGAPGILQTWSDSQDYSECKFGYFIQAQLGLRIIDGFGVGIFGRYDWLENMSGNVGQTRYCINPEGGSVGTMANLSF